MLEVRVQVMVNRKMIGFRAYEDGQWSKSKDYSGEDIYDIISQVNKEYGITSYHDEEIDEEGEAYYEAEVHGVEFMVDMG